MGVWGWALAGALVLPSLLIAMAGSTSRLVAILACATVGGAIVFAGSVSAVSRGKAWRWAALTWGCAFAAGLLTYLVIGHYSEPLGRPGDLNVVALEPGASAYFRGTRFSPAWTHGVSRLVVSVLMFAVLGGALEDSHKTTLGRSLARGALLGTVWVLCLVPVVFLAITSIYAGDLLSKLLPRQLEGLAVAASLLAGGAACGTVIGGITQVTLRRTAP